MAKIIFETGQVVNFDGNPTPADIEEVANKIGLKAPKITNQDKRGELITGVGKGALETLKGISSIGEKAIKTVLPAPAEKFLGLSPNKTIAEQRITPQMTEATTETEKLGKGIEQFAETILPASKIGKTALATEKVLGLATKPGIWGSALRIARQAIVGGETGAAIGAWEAYKEGKPKEEIINKAKEYGLTAGAFSGALQSGSELLKSVAKNFLIPGGEKILYSKIKPYERDIKDGFDIKNVEKYNVSGSLKDMADSVDTKLSGLREQMKSVLSSSDEKIDLNKVLNETKKSLSGEKTKTFGLNESIRRAIKGLEREIKMVGGKGNVDLLAANSIKTSAGQAGAWSYGMRDPNSTASERIYTAFYRSLKKAIENAGGSEQIKALNSQMGELIPIRNAIIRRLPVETRNAAIGLIESIGLVEVFSNPKALAFVAAKLLSKSAKFGKGMISTGRNILAKPQTSKVLPATISTQIIKQ